MDKATEKLPRPYCVDTALILWIGVVVLAAVQVLFDIAVSILYSDALTQGITERLTASLKQLQEQTSSPLFNYSAGDMQLAVAIVPFTNILMEILLALLLGLVIWRMSVGRKWARFALLFFGFYMGFQAIAAALVATQGQAGSSSPIVYYLPTEDFRIASFIVLCIAILQGIIAMAALIQIRKPEAYKWFDEMTAQRRPPMPPMPPFPSVPPLPPVPPNFPKAPKSPR